MLKMTLPTDADREAVLSFYDEIEKSGGACIGMSGHSDYDRWAAGMHDRHTGQNLPDGYVRENFYLCYDGPELIGVFSLKFTLTDYLLHYGGHVGYAVRPSVRRRGYATQILRQGLELAKGFGFDRLLCICDEDNIASEKVILNNGGVLEDRAFDPEENVWIRRYWIDLRP